MDLATPKGGGDVRQLALRYGVAAVAVFAASALQYSLQPLVGDRFPLAVFPLAVVVAARFGGFGPALLATLGGSLVATYLFMPRLGTLQVAGRADVASLVIFTIVGLLISLAVRHFSRRAELERDARLDAERRLRQMDRLRQLTATLLQARTPEDVIDTSLPELLHAVEARAGAIFLLNDTGSECELTHAIGYADSVSAAAQRWPMASESPLADAILRRDLVVVDDSRRRPREPASPAANPCLEFHVGDIVVPLVVGQRVIGAVVFAVSQARPFSDEDREFLMRAGRHTAQALDRARLYDAAERARADAEALRVRADSELRERHRAEEALRQSEARYRTLAARTNRLYTLSAGLSESVSLNAVARAVVRHGKVVVGAAAGSVALLVEAGSQFETLYAEEHGSTASDASRRYAASAGLCSTAAVKSHRPIFIGSFVEWQERYPESASIAADGGYVSSAALPLLADGGVLGVLSFHFTVPVNFDDEYKTLLTSVAQHCAQALDRARLYERAERARTEAEAANQSKDDFLSTISHELRTPLNAILGWAAMLRSGSVDANRTQRAIEAIFNNATRQGRLIEELLDVSRIVAGRATFDPQNIDLGENIRGAVEAMMPLAAAKGVELQFELSPGITVVADPRRLEQVFLNLLSNAVKFTPRGGRITVDVTASEESAEVRVADTGAGIDPGFLPHVFERFRQADSAPTRTAGGLGLGLFISRQLIEAQGGTIRAESEGPGCGAVLTLSLPVAGGSSASRHMTPNVSTNAPSDEGATMPALNGISVLLVDDEEDAREVMASALESCGATVISASSAREALDTLATTADIDLLLSDIAMPGQDGYELIRDIRAMPSARLAAIPAAAVTAHARDDERERALSAGFHMHLTKPVHPVALATAVASLAATVPTRGFADDASGRRSSRSA